MSRSCCYLIMAGGTGGHIFPAMAVARSLREKGASVHWLGTATGMEYQLVPAENIPLHLIHIKGFRGKGLLAKLLTPLLLLSAIFQALKAIMKIKPDAIIGFGGYVAAPGGIAARLLGKKLIIHEQNSVAGTTNKLLAKLASCSLEAFPNSLPEANRVGNPVRADIKELFLSNSVNAEKEKPADRKRLLIMGGSLGAAAINQIVPELINSLPFDEQPEVWHQAGKNKHMELIGAYRSYDINARVDEFIGDVAAAYQWADIVICRAGALTVSEIAVAGVPAIFIPYPYAIDNHQFFNAQWLVENNAAYLIEQKDLSVESLRLLLLDMLSSEKVLQDLSQHLKKLAMPLATEQVVAVCERACRGEDLTIDAVNKVLAAIQNSTGEKNNAA